MLLTVAHKLRERASSFFNKEFLGMVMRDTELEKVQDYIAVTGRIKLECLVRRAGESNPNPC